MTCEGDSRREWAHLHPGAKAKKRKKKKKKKKKNGKKKYTGVQIVHFYRLLQGDVISKRENSLGHTGSQVNSLTGLSSLIFSSTPGEVNS